MYISFGATREVIMKKMLIFSLCLLTLFAFPAQAAAEAMYAHRLEDLGLNLVLPEGWMLFTPETSDDDPNLEVLGTDAETLRQSLKDGNVRLNSVLPDLSAEITVVCSVDQRSESAFDYNLITEADLNEQGQTVIDHDFSKDAEGLDYLSFEQLQGNQARYLRFVGEINPEDSDCTYFIQYSTLMNGTAVSVALHSFGEPVSEEQEAILQEVIDSMEWDEVLEKTLSKDTKITLTVFGCILLALICSTIFFTVRYRKQQKRGEAE